MNTITELAHEHTGQFAIDLGTQHHFSSGVYAKQMHLPKGYMAISHQHNYDHLSVLASGKVIVKTDDGEQEYTAPVAITIAKHKNHAITALEDAVWFCIHATDETDSNKVDEVIIMKEEV
jgi:quercetin dioxygenase-like cupin family protein